MSIKRNKDVQIIMDTLIVESNNIMLATIETYVVPYSQELFNVTCQAHDGLTQIWDSRLTSENQRQLEMQLRVDYPTVEVDDFGIFTADSSFLTYNQVVWDNIVT
jgi:hypothetical protein